MIYAFKAGQDCKKSAKCFQFPFPHSVIKKWHFTGTEKVRVKSERPGKSKKEILVGLLEKPVRTFV